MTRTVLTLTISMAMIGAPAWAQHSGGSHKATAPHTSPAPKPATSQAHSAPKTTTSHGSAPKTTTHGSAPAKPTSAAHGSKKTATTTTTVGPAPTLTPVQLKLQRNTNLASKLQSRLPAGTNLQLASAGFRNLGQFVAAVNVSHNLGIPFVELKTRMVDRGMSLGQAIQDARPSTTNTTVVVTRAERDADDLIRTTEATKTAKTTKKPGGDK